jgi:hypothetical protein
MIVVVRSVPVVIVTPIIPLSGSFGLGFLDFDPRTSHFMEVPDTQLVH